MGEFRATSISNIRGGHQAALRPLIPASAATRYHRMQIRTIHEHSSCKVFYRFEENGTPLLELDALNAAFEYEY